MKIQLNASSIAIGLAVGALTAGGIAFAATSPSVTTINACQSKSTGALRILTTGVCKTTEVPISWNSSGPSGAQGTQGPKGDKGDTGATGAQGRPGQDAGRCSVISGTENRGMQWWSCDFSGKSFRYAALTKASLAGADISGADFTKAALQGSDLSGVDGVKAEFRGAKFDQGTLLADAVLDESDFAATSIYGVFSNTRLRGANLYGALFSGIVSPTDDPINIDFSGADLRNVKFTNARLVRANFRDAQTAGMSFAEAWFDQTDFTMLTLPASAFDRLKSAGNSNFSGLNLAGVSWRPDRLQVSGYDGLTYYANSPWLGNSNFSGANLTNAKLTGVGLSGSNVEGTNFAGATFAEQICDDAALRDPGGMFYGRTCKTPTTAELKSWLCGLVGTPAALPNGWRFEGGCIRNW